MNRLILNLAKQEIKLTLRQINQLSELLCATGYFEYCNLNNKLGLSAKELFKQLIIEPLLVHTQLVLDSKGNIAGAMIAGFKLVNHNVMNLWRDDPQIKYLLVGINELEQLISPHDYVLHYFAVRYDLQGVEFLDHSQKLADLLFTHLLAEAKDSGAKHLALICWKSHHAAVKFYQRYNAKIIKTIDLSASVFHDKIYLMKINLRQ